MKQRALVFALSVTVGLVIELFGLSGQCAESARQIFAVAPVKDITIEILPSTAKFTSVIFVELPEQFGSRKFPIGTNKDVGKIVSLLDILPPGTDPQLDEFVLRFGISVHDTRDAFFTGPADANPDNMVHATIDLFGPFTLVISFEEMAKGRDLSFDDVIIRVEQVELIPSPSTSIRSSLFALRQRGQDTAQSACEYYKAIKAVNDATDCTKNPITFVKPIRFEEWKDRNGFARNPLLPNAEEVTAHYLNVGDLNLARAMHGKQQGKDVAYYVCNHDTIEEAIDNTNVRACVAMEYSALPKPANPSARLTKFYVFKGENLSSSAQLDFQGEKFVPGLCVACHGGDAYNPNKVVSDIGAHFLPFDLDNFTFPDMPGFTKDDQEAKFEQLNKFILQTNVTSVVKELIDHWYCDQQDPRGQCVAPRDTQNTAFVPPGWLGASHMYLQVVKPSCRTCHSVAPNDQRDPMTGQALRLDWRTSAQFLENKDPIKTAVCGDKFAYMPNAEVTFNRFWFSRDRPQVITIEGKNVPQHQRDILTGFLGIPPNECLEPGSR
jgi:hypothetical protein